MSTIIPRSGHTTYILSGYQSDKTEHESWLAHDGLARDLAQLVACGRVDTFAHCRGAYKGEPERSIAVTGASCKALRATILELAKKYRQESVLIVTSALAETSGGVGGLIYTDGRPTEYIGHYGAIDSTNGVDAWTEVCATGETFTFI